jgi:Peptidase family S41
MRNSRCRRRVIIGCWHALALILTGAATVSAQQSPASSDSAPTCAQNLELMKQKLEANYGGFVLEVKGPKLSRYEAAVAKLRQSATTVSSAACFRVLKDYIAWFDDPHLFVYQSGTLDSAETRRRSVAVEKRSLTEAEARAYFARNAKGLDAIEGIWYDRALRLAVVKDTGRAAGRFVAVVVTTDTAAWPLGAVRAEFTKRRDGSYDALVREKNFAERIADAQIFRRTVLRLSPGMWGKLYPVAAADSGLLDTMDVHRPTLTVRNGTVIVSVPSHDPSFQRTLNGLIAEHATALRDTRRLIIDLRGNEGGSSFMSNGLLPYIASDSQRPFRLRESDAVMLSSPDQIRYARRAFGSDTTRFVRTLLERLQANPGRFVPLADPTLPPAPARRDSVVPGERKVAVLIDRGTVSASEVLLLYALRSRRTTVFGEPTAGALDYQSTSIAALSPNEKRWYLGYPTITRDTLLPKDGMRGVGIQPDVKVDWTRLANPIAEIERRLEQRR